MSFNPSEFVAFTQKRSEGYIRYLGLLIQLHQLMASEATEDELDVIRDQMDGPWYGATPIEIEILGLLSEDLYKLDSKFRYKEP